MNTGADKPRMGNYNQVYRPKTIPDLTRPLGWMANCAYPKQPRNNAPSGRDRKGGIRL